MSENPYVSPTTASEQEAAATPVGGLGWYWACCFLAMLVGGMGTAPIALSLLIMLPFAGMPSPLENWLGITCLAGVMHLNVWIALFVGVVFSLSRSIRGPKLLTTASWAGVVCELAGFVLMTVLTYQLIVVLDHDMGPPPGIQAGEALTDRTVEAMLPIAAWEFVVLAGLIVVAVYTSRPGVRARFAAPAASPSTLTRAVGVED